MNKWFSEQINTEYPLNGESIDEIAGETQVFLNKLGMERSNIFRIRLSMEEALLRWMDHFGPGKKVRLLMGRRLFRPYISLELEGESCDPLHQKDTELGSWADSLLSDIGYMPQYNYRRGINVLQLRLQPPAVDPTMIVLGALILGALIGAAGRYILPEASRTTLVNAVLGPVYTAYLRVLNAAAGPIVFLSVLTSVCGIGTSTSMEHSGRRMVRRFLLMSTMFAVISMLLASLLFRLRFRSDTISAIEVNGLMDLLFLILPSDLVTPFQEGNSIQIIFLALVFGNAILVVGNSATPLRQLLEQLNSVTIVITEWVSSLTPLFLMILVALGIIDRTGVLLLSLWKPLLFGMLLMAATAFCCVWQLCRREKISLSIFWKKAEKSFTTAFRSASVGASLGENIVCCERYLGVNSTFTKQALPLGLVVYMPAGTIATMVMTIYAASSYNTRVSIFWYIAALVMVTALQMASPPVTGAGVWSYVMIFARLGIPSNALILAIVLDVLFGFSSAAFNQLMLQTELVLEADRLGILNRELLKKSG